MAEVIAGKYRLVRKLGQGGMAAVYLARAEGAVGFERDVVIKRLDPALARDPDAMTMLLDEARIAASLHHDHIAQVFDFGRDDDGYFIVMEYLVGRDARQLVRACPSGIALPQAVAIVMRAAAGLHYAHEQRDAAGQPLHIVHRDVTGGNVFVTFEGGVKVIDFGIARSAVRSTVTRAGFVKGTVAYMSPEQVQGLVVDRRSDVFSLGVVLYELVTGRRPFDQPGDPELTIMRRIEAGIATPPSAVRTECPPQLEEVIERMLAADPVVRVQTAEAVAVALDAVARSQGWSTTAIDLGRYVRALLPPDPAAVEAVVAPAASAPGSLAAATRVDRPRSSPSAPPPAQSLAPAPAAPAPPRPRRSGRWIVAVLAVAASAAAAIGGFALVRRNGSTTSVPHDASIQLAARASDGGVDSSSTTSDATEPPEAIEDNKAVDAWLYGSSANEVAERKAVLDLLARSPSPAASPALLDRALSNADLPGILGRRAQELAVAMFTRGAEANATDTDTPFLVHFAQLARPAAIRILLAHGADPDAADENHWTALHWLASYGPSNPDIAAAAAMLLDAKANVNARSTLGSTPLHVAAQNDSTAIAELLVARGADLDAVDTSGYSALPRAKPGVQAVLLKHGAHELRPR